MSDRNKGLGKRNLKQAQQQHPKLVARAKQIAQKRKVSDPVVPDNHWKVMWGMLLALLAVDSRKLYGEVVSKNTKPNSQAVATMGTIANVFNTITAFPLALFAMADIPLLGLPLAIAITLLVLKGSNLCVEVAAVYKPSNRLQSEVGLAGVVALSAVQTIVSGVGSQLFLDQPAISNRFAENLVETQVVESLENNVRILESDKYYQKSQQECELLEEILFKTPANTDQSSRVFNKLYGNYEDSQLPLEQRGFYSSPVSQWPLCPKAREEERQYIENLTVAKDKLKETKAKVAEEGSLTYLKEQKPDTYQQNFDRNEELKSGNSATTTAFEIFSEKIANGNWTSLGLTSYIFSLSIITSAISVLLIAIHARSEEIQASRSNPVSQEKEAYLAEFIAELGDEFDDNDSSPPSPSIADYTPYSYTDEITSTSNGNGKHH